MTATRQSYANAGAGLPVSPFGGTESYVYFACLAQAKWVEEHSATGKGPETLIGSYSPSPGVAPFRALDPSDPGKLRASLAQLFAETRSCSFQLTGGAKLALDKASTGTVLLDGQPVPSHAQNGWHLESETVLQLSGTACAALRASSSAQLSLQFPCSAITD